MKPEVHPAILDILTPSGWHTQNLLELVRFNRSAKIHFCTPAHDILTLMPAQCAAPR